MDAADLAELERQKLEEARAKLTEQEKAYLDRRCDVLRSEKAYAEKHELELALAVKDTPQRYLADVVRPIEQRAFEEARAIEAKQAHAAGDAALLSRLDALQPQELQKTETPAQQPEANLETIAPEQKRALEPEMHAVAASHDRRHGVADYSLLPQAQVEEKPIVQEFHAAAREVTEHKPTPGRGGDGQGQSPPSPQGPAPTLSNINRPMTGDEILSRDGNPELQQRFTKEQAEQRARTSDSATPAAASPCRATNNASADPRAELTAREERRAWLERQATRERDGQDRERANDGLQRGGPGGRTRGR